MKKIIELAIERAGLTPLLAACRAGNHAFIRETQHVWSAADLLALGAVAEDVRARQVGNVVQIEAHGIGVAGEAREVLWANAKRVVGVSDLDLLRRVAVLRISEAGSDHIGVDASECGLELAQVALGFGASALRGAIARKSGLVILDGETRKLKGQGQVDLRQIKKLEVEALVKHAGRVPLFVDGESVNAASVPEPPRETALPAAAVAAALREDARV